MQKLIDAIRGRRTMKEKKMKEIKAVYSLHIDFKYKEGEGERYTLKPGHSYNLNNNIKVSYKDIADGVIEIINTELEKELKKYLISELEKIPNLILYNKNSDCGILAFNIEGVFAQETSIYLNHYHICVRAGNHCTKMLKDNLGVKNTVRVSMYLYNNKDCINTSY